MGRLWKYGLLRFMRQVWPWCILLSLMLLWSHPTAREAGKGNPSTCPAGRGEHSVGSISRLLFRAVADNVAVVGTETREIERL